MQVFQRSFTLAQKQLVRTFCAAAATEAPKKVTKATLSINSVTGRYAGQVFDIAEEHEINHQDVLESLYEISGAIENDKLLRMFLEDSSNSVEDKATTLEQLYDRLEGFYAEGEEPSADEPAAAAADEDDGEEELEIDELAKDMVDLLLENKELNLLTEIVDDYHRVVLDYNKEVEAVVTTAQPLTGAQEEAVFAKLTALSPGKTVIMDTAVDGDLLGGMTVHLGESFQDLSVRSALTLAEANLRAQ